SRVRHPRHPHRHGDGRGSARRAPHDLSGGWRLSVAGCRRRHGRGLHHGVEPARLQSRPDLGTAVLRPGIRRLAHSHCGAATDHCRSPCAPRSARCCRATWRRRMDLMTVISVLVTIVLWTLVAVLALTAAVRSKALCREGLWEGSRDFVVLIPRVLVGGIRTGYW